ncbi:MAG TPA: stage II sporulation protein M [Burkholderiales bacterium]|nr:stage II sporulation protein M [Burkholderiales bacterium]
MKQAPFELAHAGEWDEFEAFLDQKPSFDPAEMPARFRRLCQHLALAAERRYSADLVDRLNRLALRGHHALYSHRRRESQQVLDFMAAGFPRLVRLEWRLVTAAAVLFFGPLLALIALLQHFPDFAHYLLAPEQIASFHQMYDPANRRIGMREADTHVMMFGFYIWNNVRIGFQTFAGGMLAGVGSAWFLGANGVIIGAVAGYLTHAGFGETFWSFVAGHSAPELIAIVLSGAAGLRLGLAVIAPGNMSRKAALVAAARPAVRIMYGAALLFLAAALVEAFWSPLTEVPFGTKIAVGIVLWALILAYLILAGRARAAR